MKQIGELSAVFLVYSKKVPVFLSKKNKIRRKTADAICAN